MKDCIQILNDVLFNRKANQKRNRITNIVPILKNLIYKQYCKSNTQKFQVLMKLEPCTILKVFLNFRASEP